MKLIVYTDGASRGNPGHSSYGFTIQDDSGKILYQEGKYIGIATNNVAEYTAVFKALKYVSDNLFQKGNLKISLYADSKLVAEQLSGRYKIKASHLKPIIADIRKLSSQFKEITYSHIPRSQNGIADSLANQALDSR